ncbi:group 1 glycosyl transferase [Vibrio sp. qd031]|uniref:glycosyltransferase family 4 protein n=1 Tax=Vibrio sp. qd031 TaxID=1603038 RepID=UPI000A1127D1|nr:glycosyltransferase family 4 protein [Vibrio sp. qd031]ORT51859.1 group 1 glycosyl transferase [Vibrio sp. qd031]
MKIALVHLRHAYSGGVELYLNKLAAYMAEKGEDVTIICRSHDKRPPHPKVKFVKLKGLSIGKTHRLWRFAKDVEQHVKHSDYDLVYGLAHAWTHDVLRIGAGTSFHQSKALGRKMRFKDKVNNAIERKAMTPGAYQHVICNSEKSAGEIKELHHVPDDKITVIHNFVDTTHFDSQRVKTEAEALKNELMLNDDLPIFLFLGTGYDRKGLKPTLEAFSKLDYEARLIVVGRESREQDYINYAKQLGIADSCMFLGERRQPELFFSIADCYVLPTKYEPFGFTVIEALSCGIPVITTQQCGAKEVLTADVSTIVSSHEDISGLVEAMTYWASKFKDSTLKSTCREVALRNEISTVLEKNYQKLLDVYDAKFKHV